jgi:hypothetical protein
MLHTYRAKDANEVERLCVRERVEDLVRLGMAEDLGLALLLLLQADPRHGPPLLLLLLPRLERGEGRSRPHDVREE